MTVTRTRREGPIAPVFDRNGGGLSGRPAFRR